MEREKQYVPISQEPFRHLKTVGKTRQVLESHPNKHPSEIILKLGSMNDLSLGKT